MSETNPPKYFNPEFKCTLCKRHTGMFIYGQGNVVADIMIVGDYTDPKDQKDQLAFSGRDSAKLEYLLEESGLSAGDVFVTNAIKCNANTTAIFAEAQICSSYLKEEIEFVKPKVVITMGRFATHLFLRQIDFSSARGFAFPVRDKDGGIKFWVLPMNTIRYSHAYPEEDDIFIKDFKQAKALTLGHKPKPLDFNVKVLTSLEEVRSFAVEIKEKDVWSFDLETSGLEFYKHKILCFAFGTSDKDAIVIPFEKDFEDGQRWPKESLAEIIEIMKDVFDCKSLKIAQNGKFDLSFLKKHGIRVRNFKFDTMLAHHLINVNHPHDLLFLGQWYGLVDRYYNMEVDKLKSKGFENIPSKALFTYAGIDAAITYALYPILSKQLQENELDHLYSMIPAKLSYVLHDMEYGGIKLDKPRLLNMAEFMKSRSEEIVSDLRGITANPEFKPGSVKQVTEYCNKNNFLQAINESEIKKTKGGKVSFDEEMLEKLLKTRKEFPFVSLLLEHRKIQKLKGTYLDGKDGESGLLDYLDTNDFLHGSFNIHGTISGRLASSNPNCQTFPRDLKVLTRDGVEKNISIRSLFIPDDPDSLLLSVDYKQLEVRVAAALSEDPVLIAEIKEGVDMHSRNAASLLLNIPEEEFKKIYKDKDHPLAAAYSDKRTAAKASTFGVLYGSTPEGVAKRNNIKLEVAQDFIFAFFKKYKVLKQWIKEQHKNIEYTGQIRTYTKRIVRFPSLKFAQNEHCPNWRALKLVGEAERIAVNLPIQSYGSDIFQTSKINLMTALHKRRMKSRLLLSLHDGFLMNVVPKEKAMIEKLVYEHMTREHIGRNSNLLFEVDLTFTDRWGHAGE